MPTPFAAGENYSIEIEGTRAVVRVWRRPDITAAGGASSANEMAAHLRALTSQKLRSVLLDLRSAPSVAGPRTVETMGELLRDCERADVRIAVALTDDAMQLLQFRRLVSTYAPTRGRVATALSDAEAWVLDRAAATPSRK